MSHSRRRRERQPGYWYQKGRDYLQHDLKENRFQNSSPSQTTGAKPRQFNREDPTALDFLEETAAVAVENGKVTEPLFLRKGLQSFSVTLDIAVAHLEVTNDPSSDVIDGTATWTDAGMSSNTEVIEGPYTALRVVSDSAAATARVKEGPFG